MYWVNVALKGTLEVMLWPLSSFHPIVGLSLVSLIASVAILLVVRATSDQPSLVAVRRRIQAALFEMRLLNDDVRAMLRAAGEMLRGNLAYLRFALIPALWVTMPLLLLLIHLQFYYGYDGLAVGANTVVKVRLDGAALPPEGAEAPNVSLDAPPGLRVETPLVWIPSEREAAWRIVTEKPGDYQLVVTLDGEAATKHVRVSPALGWRSPDRLEEGFLNQLWAPAEPPIASAARISSIHVAYPPRELSVLGFRTHWTIPFLVISVGFTFGLRKRFGVVL